MDRSRAELLDIAREAARRAGEVIMPIYASDFRVERKADRTVVTEADRRAEEVLRDFLQRECPGHGILGEEHGEIPGDGRYRWVLDPIDGTTSFVHRVPLFGTLVALEEDGEPVVGVIACHAAGETVSAAAGLGAYLGDERIHVSATRDLGEATVTTTGGHMAGSHPGVLDRLSTSVATLRMWGDCYGYLMVATGRADAMLDPILNHWDVAALIPIITEAGGRITQWDGEQPARTQALATNGHVHAALASLLAAP